MLSCTPICVKSRSFESATFTNLAAHDTETTSYPAACSLCDQPAKIVCSNCYCTSYCTPVCLVKDRARHKCECLLHSTRLWSFRRFERHSAQTVRYKHTGKADLGIGMFARRAFKPGERILEDCVQCDTEMIIAAVDNKDFSKFAYIESFLTAIYGAERLEDTKTFSLHTNQITGMTGGYMGSWSSLINHSCSPNCVMMVSECRQVLLLTAIRPIAQNDEITVAYTGYAYAPLSIRKPVLHLLLGQPCMCKLCVTPNQGEEHGRRVVWEVVQHSRNVTPTELFVLSKETPPKTVIAIAKNVIAIARSVLGATRRYSAPWLAIVECTVAGYLEDACELNPSPKLLAYMRRTQQEAYTTSQHVGVCTRLLMKN